MTSSPPATRCPARSGRSARRWSTTRCASRRKRPAIVVPPACAMATPRRLTAGPQRGLELVAEFGEFVGADVADRPEVHALFAPAPDIEALHGFHLGRTTVG